MSQPPEKDWWDGWGEDPDDSHKWCHHCGRSLDGAVERFVCKDMEACRKRELAQYDLTDEDTKE